MVQTEKNGRKRIDKLDLGERIAAVDSSGNVVYSEVIAFLDRSTRAKRQFVRLATESKRTLTLTPSHLVPVEGKSAVFGSEVQVNDRILVRDMLDPTETNEVDETTRLRWDRVVKIDLVLEEGVYAPLTREGTIIVDDVVASCYAVISSQNIAHYAFLPFRLWSSLRSVFTSPTSDRSAQSQPEGLNWYATVLYSISSFVLPHSMFYH